MSFDDASIIYTSKTQSLSAIITGVIWLPSSKQFELNKASKALPYQLLTLDEFLSALVDDALAVVNFILDRLQVIIIHPIDGLEILDSFDFEKFLFADDNVAIFGSRHA